MSRVRSFDEVVIAHGDGRMEALRIVCGKCGGIEYYLHKTGRKAKPPEAVMQNFRRKGWVVGNQPARDRCPHCSRSKTEKKEVGAMAVKGKPAATFQHAEKPKDMQRDDRRIITEKLDEVYGEKGYRGTWTDAAVARDLNVPRAWVSDVREAFFGAEGSNPLFDEYKVRKAEFEGAYNAFKEARKAHCEEHDRLLKMGMDISKKADDLRSLGQRVERELG